MLNSVLVGVALLQQGTQVQQGTGFQQRTEGVRVHMPELAARPGATPRLNLWWLDEPIPMTKLSPKKFGPTKEPYTFDWVVAGFARLDIAKPQATVRFRVYNQLKPKEGDETFGATRLLLRLWETIDTWGFDHSYDYAAGTVDVYLCWGGTPGGEALLDHDPQVPKGVNDKVATIYIYDLPSFKTPVERLREVAHEYGHIVLPAIGGYSDPEDWNNGILGERLFLAQMANDLKSGAVPSTDAFNILPSELNGWLSRNVVPHRDRAAVEGPFSPWFVKRDKSGMDAFVGEATFLQSILPSNRFGRVLRLMEAQRPEAMIKSAALAIDEGGTEFTIPATLKGRALWIPVGKTKLSGGKILARRSGWAKIQPTRATISLKL